jgi:hypothetical protein
MAWRRDLPLFAGMPPGLDAEPDQIGRPCPTQDFKNFRRGPEIQFKPRAMQAISTALPRVDPRTVIKAARIPRVAPVVITKVTIPARDNDEDEGNEQKAEKRW